MLGSIFFAHGAQKLFGMFGGIGIEGTTRMMEGLGFYAPETCAVVWSFIEFFGGIFLAFGVLARYAALLLSFIMAISILKINASYGFFIQNGGYEYNLLIIVSCLPVILLGGGKWSLWDV
ncbi:MAG: DoxX family protein [Candidatus Omnitrophica bacterium]|nr:DoxX family protein [Candidatus Omnitrophota bacterium]